MHDTVACHSPSILTHSKVAGYRLHCYTSVIPTKARGMTVVVGQVYLALWGMSKLTGRRFHVGNTSASSNRRVVAHPSDAMLCG